MLGKVDVNIERISDIDNEMAQKYALKVMSTGKKYGQLDGYKFAVKEMGTSKMTFFIDTSEQRENFRVVLFVSTAIAILCWLVLLVIVILLSGKVIRPLLVGIEKQKQFITNAGHEMKTPLAIIQSNNETMMLIHGENKYNAHIRTQTKRLNGLMSNLLTLAKLDEEIPFSTELTNVNELVQELLPLRLFERFYRGDAARTQTKDTSGYGIGLFAARAICENFGGKLTAEYTSDESICFTVKF